MTKKKKKIKQAASSDAADSTNDRRVYTLTVADAMFARSTIRLLGSLGRRQRRTFANLDSQPRRAQVRRVRFPGISRKVRVTVL